ncbi:VOC family protein [Tropicimonas aquimaris]|uniref:VOC family protein n=1 Tax=Tropicimonas aquimaris TaxID=914152 RepID=A0ABW3IPY3_9RHOB
MISDLRTCLWFNGDGGAAAEFYVSLLPDSRIDHVGRRDSAAAPRVIRMTLGGVPYMILDVPPAEGMPQVTHGPAASISVLTGDQAETDRLWAALTAGGGAESVCGWLTDRFGVLWQIVPEALPRMLESEDRAAAGRAREAMMQMGKLDIAALEAAFAGD